MKHITILLCAAALASCASDTGDRGIGGFANDYFRNAVPHVASAQEMEMVNRTYCHADGATPGTPEFAQCVALRTLADSNRRRAGNSANSGSGFSLPPQPEAGLGANGQSCLGYTTQTAYGPQFNCQR